MTAAATCTLLVTSLLVNGPAASADDTSDLPTPPLVALVPHTDVPLVGDEQDPIGDDPQLANATWPSPTSSTVTLTPPGATGKQKVAKVGVLEAGNSSTAAPSAASAPARVTLAVASQATAKTLGVVGVVATARRVDTSSAGFQISVDYAAFRNAVGADYGSRLALFQMPACAVTTPSLSSCRTRTPISYVNDPRQQKLIATISSAKTSSPGSRNTPAPASIQDGAGSSLVLAAAAAPAGSNGSFAATPLAASGSWSVSGASGAFTWQMPIMTPPAPSGTAVNPNLAFSYSSASIDGRIASTNNQGSMIGEGWDSTPGYIERTYRACSTNKSLPTTAQTGDLCWAGQILTLSLGGKTTSIVQDDAHKNIWRAADDDGSVISLHNEGTGAYQGEYWTVTLTNGVTYSFGLNSLPGAPAGTVTNSTWTVPVRGTGTNDPCFNGSDPALAASTCTQAWRWNLDLAEDPVGNAAAYYYKLESNYYGAYNQKTPIGYTRNGYLDHIDYGLHDSTGSLFRATAPERVDYGYDERCDPTNSTGTIVCNDSTFTATNASHWPDTPQDQNCLSSGDCNNHAPTFWTRLKLNTVTTKYWTGTGTNYTPIDRYSLVQSFPTDGDSSMRLDTITRTANPGLTGEIGLTPITFHGALFDNRVDGYNPSQSDMAQHRLVQIDTDSGMRVTVQYSQPGRSAPLCTATSTPADPTSNTSECFQAKWVPPYQVDPITDLFHKYVVTEVDEQDTAALAPKHVTAYNYIGTPAWHYDDNEVTKPTDRTWSQFRGYKNVEIRTGDIGTNAYGEDTGPADKLTLTRTTYYRGMNGDRKSDGSKTTGINVADSLGEGSRDDNYLADRVRESQTFVGDSSTQLTSTISDYALLGTTATRARPSAGLDPLTAIMVRPTKTRALTNSSKEILTTVLGYDTIGRQTSTQTSGVAIDAQGTAVELTRLRGHSDSRRRASGRSARWGASRSSRQSFVSPRSRWSGRPASRSLRSLVILGSTTAR